MFRPLLCYNYPMADKIINTFQQRRQLEKAFASMAKTESELGLIQLAQSIVHQYPTKLILTTFVKHLGTVDSQLRGGLGHLATLLPTDEILPILHNVTTNRRLDPTERFNAAMIIERFLGEETAAGAMADLSDSNELAFQSLCEAVDEGKRDRHILYDYVSQLREEPEEIALIVLEQLQRLPSADRLELLRLLAQDDRPMVAIGALEYLELLDPADAGEGLLRTLHTLQFTTPPDHAQRIERHLRKLRFRGQTYRIPDASRWRALITPAEASGNQNIWFIEETDGKTGTFLSIVHNGYGGILQTMAIEQMHKEDLPPRHKIGELLSASVGIGEALVFLETPFDYGRWLVQQALTAHWNGMGWREFFDEYTLYNDLIWQFDAPKLDDDIVALYAAENTTKDAEENVTKNIAEITTQQSTIVNELLHHPVMVAWVIEVRTLLHLFNVLSQHRTNRATGDRAAGDQIGVDKTAPDGAPSNAEATISLLCELATAPGGIALLHGIQAGLKAQAGWLHIAGSPQTGQHALQIARSIDPEKPEKNLFLIELFSRVLGD